MLKAIRIVLAVFATIQIINALWMLIAPQHWYENLPAHVPEYGPLNTHFVRDVGAIFLIAGIALGAAAVRPVERRALILFAVLIFGSHAVVHIGELLAGGAAAHLWKSELATVYLPIMVLIFIWYVLGSTRT